MYFNGIAKNNNTSKERPSNKAIILKIRIIVVFSVVICKSANLAITIGIQKQSHYFYTFKELYEQTRFEKIYGRLDTATDR